MPTNRDPIADLKRTLVQSSKSEAHILQSEILAGRWQKIVSAHPGQLSAAGVAEIIFRDIELEFGPVLEMFLIQNLNGGHVTVDREMLLSQNAKQNSPDYHRGCVITSFYFQLKPRPKCPQTPVPL